ncbi:MAG: aspartate-alanine antiporter [Muribaculaceae bacterium]|nr:aspartate-alanine antiporter [Muribaculaceae bacterium]
MDWIIEICRNNPAIPLFLTIGVGFYVGQLKFKGFSLGTVTSVLLVGVLVGQMDIQIPGPIKNVFFLLFLFAIGYSVGPQFFRSLRGAGLKQVCFAVVECLLVLVCTWGVCRLMGYNVGETLGVFAGSQTISAAIGAGIDSLGSLGASSEQVKQWADLIPVAYAVTYVFGTIGSAWILSWLGPKMLGGLDKVKADTKALEKEMNSESVATDPGFVNANRPVAFRAYKAEADYFSQPRSIDEIEQYMLRQGKRLFVERVRQGGEVVEIGPDVKVSCGDEIVLSGRREFIVGDEQWIGPEVNDAELLSFPAEKIDVMVKKKAVGRNGMTVDELRRQKFMYGITIKSISRGGVSIPVFARTVIEGGDTLTIVGLEREVNEAAPQLGYADRASTATDLILVGLGIVVGCLIGLITIHAGSVPVSLSTSGGALISGLVCGWLRSKHPTFGRIPKPALWVFNNLGLNMFIAVIGITSGPTFVSGLQQVGWMVFVVGAVATTLPLIISLILGAKVFKFRPAINLGCCAGSRTTTAALGAIQDALGSTVPAMGYTITYAVGNTLLILMGVALVLIS